MTTALRVDDRPALLLADDDFAVRTRHKREEGPNVVLGNVALAQSVFALRQDHSFLREALQLRFIWAVLERESDAWTVHDQLHFELPLQTRIAEGVFDILQSAANGFIVTIVDLVDDTIVIKFGFGPVKFRFGSVGRLGLGQGSDRRSGNEEES